MAPDAGDLWPHSALLRNSAMSVSSEDLQVEAERPVGDVVVVPLDALSQRGLSAQAVHLRPAGDPRLDPVAVAVADDVLLNSSTNSGRSGRGPMMLISPRSTFSSWGSSSSEERRRSARRGAPIVSLDSSRRGIATQQEARARSSRRRLGSAPARAARASSGTCTGRIPCRRGRRGAGGRTRAQASSGARPAPHSSTGESTTSRPSAKTRSKRVLERELHALRVDRRERHQRSPPTVS